MKYLFPVVIILLDLGASIAYLILKDYRHSIYWLAAEILTVTVTF